MDELFSPAQVAQILGLNVETVRQRIRSGEIRATPIGTGPRPHLRVSTGDVRDYLLRCSREHRTTRPAL